MRIAREGDGTAFTVAKNLITDHIEKGGPTCSWTVSAANPSIGPIERQAPPLDFSASALPPARLGRVIRAEELRSTRPADLIDAPTLRAFASGTVTPRQVPLAYAGVARKD
jgi:hypothetical protein